MNGEPRALVDAWQSQAEWSARASLLKARLARHRSTVLWLVVGTAVLGGTAATLTAAGTTGGLLTALNLASALLAGTAGVLQAFGSRENVVEQWNRARSVSEALKEAVYRYRTGTGRYAGDDRGDVLRARAAEIVDRGRDLLSVVVPETRPSKPPPPELDAAAYVERRVSQQIDGYYRKQVAALSAARRRWQRGEQVLLFTGAALGAVAATWPALPLASWLTVVTTVAGAVAAHAEAARFSHLIVAYRATADRLAAVKAQFQDDRDRGRVDVAQLVDRAEDAISVENQAWMAAWSGSS